MGIGVQYPHLWELVKRYILRGDTYFQAGGLATLAANVHSMPLDEAADVLEEYYRKHDYWPPMGQSGRINLGGLKAIHAVGTIPTWLGGEAPIRRHVRMAELLERIQAKAKDVVPQDAPIVDEVRTAMQGDRPFTAGDWLSRSSAVSRGKGPSVEEVVLTEGGSEDEMRRDEVVALVQEAVTTAIADSTVSQSDITAAKHGLEIIGERIASLNQRIDDFQMVLSAGLGHTQVTASKSQVFWAKIAIPAAIVTSVVGTLAVQWLMRQMGWFQ